MDRSDLRVAPELASFLEEEALPGTGVDPEPSGRGSRRSCTSSVRATRRCCSGAPSCRRRSTPGMSSGATSRTTGRPTRPSSPRSATCCPRAATSPSRPRTSTPRSRRVPGPQLVVPITNARFALNAANARWGSLYDALYGTDAMGSAPPAGGYDRGRGARVVARARVFLDEAFPLAGTSHADARRYHVHGGALLVDDMPLIEPEKFVGYRGHPRAPEAVLLRNNGLHVRAGLRPHPSDRQPRPGGAGRRAAGERGLGDHGLRGLGRLRRRRGQGDGLSQLARPDEGRPVGDLREGRPAADPQPQPGPDLHRAGRRRGLGEGPRADAGAQRRAPDDQPRDPRPRRGRGLRGADGRDGDDADRAARPEEDGRAAQLGHRVGLRGQAEDARPRRGGLRRRDLHPRRGGARAAAGTP